MSRFNPTAILYDEEGNPIRVDVEGAKYSISIRDEMVVLLLEGILTELRKMNMHLAEGSSLGEIHDEDVQ